MNRLKMLSMTDIRFINHDFRGQVMKSPDSLARVHWDHEPIPIGKPAPLLERILWSGSIKPKQSIFQANSVGEIGIQQDMVKSMHWGP